jgi:hypothetical protein
MTSAALLTLVSPVAGFLGAVVQKGIGIFEERQRHKNEMERLELASRIDVQKADIALRQTREEQAGEAFTAAINAQAQAVPSHRWARDLVALFRPGLTTLVLVATIIHAWYLDSNGVDSTEFWQGVANLAYMSFAYWFGMRSFEKAPEIRLAAPAKK